MKILHLLVVVLLLLASCKNSSEKEVNKELSENDAVEIEALPEVEDLSIDNAESEDYESEQKLSSETSIFDINERYVYVPKDALSEEELKMYNELSTVKTRESNNNFIVSDNGEEFQINLRDLKTHLSNDTKKLNSFKNSIERKVTHSSISKGFEINGITRIREWVNKHSGSFVEDLLGAYLLKSRIESQTALRRLGVASRENSIPILCDLLEITKAELELLKLFPPTEKLSNSNMAKTALHFKIPEAVNAHLKSVDCTEGFKKIITLFTKRQTKEPNRFIKMATAAKEEFYTLNPGWYGSEDDIGNTYIDSRRKYIYLPFGSLSFADHVVSHELGSTPGSNAPGTLGEPDMALENFRLADPRVGNLGINGVLTLEFSDNTLTNVNGPDLYVFEMGRIEPTKLEISKNGKDWIEIGKIEGGTAKVDIEGFVKPGETFNYVRLTDLNTFSTLPGADVDAVATIGGALRLNLDSAVLFDTGEFKLKESAAAALRKLAEAVAEIPSGTIIVEGHTDNVGDPKSNKVLSENRAREVSNYLKQKLPKQYTFKVLGYGESQPIVPNDTKDNKQKNRRVEILVIPKN
jgi:outer membrane protein OmpA-like peptidoglycan-associated protein